MCTRFRLLLTPTQSMVYPDLLLSIKKAEALPIQDERLPVLNQLIDYSKDRLGKSQEIRLNFICTHNSRRSQFSQIWAQVAASCYNVPAKCFSGGVEVTAFNERAVASIRRSGFKVSCTGTENPTYKIDFSDLESPITAFSKLYDDRINPPTDFAAIMTCADADDNCPFISGTDVRIPLRYEDPKAFDDTDQEEAMYDERSLQIASELLFVFKSISIFTK